MDIKQCASCRVQPLTKDEIGLSRKLLGVQTPELFCLDCMAERMECSVLDLVIKIEEFKRQSCALFK